MSIYYVAGLPFSSELYHHGIKGQKWGVRRYQNLDGTLTPEGRERYLKNSDGIRRRFQKTYDEINLDLQLSSDSDWDKKEHKLKKIASKYDPLLKSINDIALKETDVKNAANALNSAHEAKIKTETHLNKSS